MTNTVRFENLPAEVQAEVKETLKAFPKCSVYFEYGEYHVMTGCFLKNRYADDFKTYGCYKDVDVFTEDERTANYIECFEDYPIWYKGKRNYRRLRELIETGKKITIADLEAIGEESWI